MGRELFNKLRANFEQVCQEIPDTRRAGHIRYAVDDCMKYALAVYQSLLDFQRQMQERLNRNILETVFRVREIPVSTRIRTVMDQPKPEHLSPLFNLTLKTASAAGLLEGCRVLDGGALTALDRVWCHLPGNIRCGQCLHVTKDDAVAYCHVALAGAIVKPGDTPVLPVMAEMTANGDGEKKQDCELTVTKRRRKSHGEEYARLKSALPGDGLYSREPFAGR